MNVGGKKKLFKKLINYVTGEVVQQLGHGALSVEPGLIANTYMAAHNHLYITPAPAGPLSAPDMQVTQT